MRPKRIYLNDGTVIIDGLSKLLVIDKEFAGVYFPEKYDSNVARELNRGVKCAAKNFVTKKGREAIRVFKGEQYIFRYYCGSGSRLWGGWESRRIANALFSDARATSNGGGCWLEVEIFSSEITPITATQMSYIDELQQCGFDQNEG